MPGGAEARHNRAWDYLYAGQQGAAAATDARSFLRTAGWRISVRRSWCWWHTWARQSGAEARGILDEATGRLNTAAWPYPIVAYMRGELTADRLMEIAATNDQKTEAHTYLGMDLLLRGRAQDAREHFVWGTRLRQQALHRCNTRSLWPSSAGCSGDSHVQLRCTRPRCRLTSSRSGD